MILGHCLLLNLDAVTVAAKSPRDVKNPNESISIQCGLKSITVSLPKIHSNLLSEVLLKDESTSGRMLQHDILSNLLLKPWNVNVELLLVWQRWNLFRKNPWKCLKIDSENIMINLSPCFAEKLSEIVSNYSKLYTECFPPSGCDSRPAPAENTEGKSTVFQ